MAAVEPLPAPRAVLTSLINSLATQPAGTSRARPQAQTVAREGKDAVRGFSHHSSGKGSGPGRPDDAEEQTGPDTDITQQNPLAGLPLPARAVLTTLHVLYPGLLLPALDLLDRGLVTRVVVGGEQGNSSGSSLPTRHVPPGEGHGGQDSDKETGMGEQHDEAVKKGAAAAAARTRRANTFHLVRSAAQSSSGRRGRRPGGGDASAMGIFSGGITYVVRTAAWNCDCAAFAFAAFPAAGSITTATTAATTAAITTTNNDDDDDDNNDNDKASSATGGFAPRGITAAAAATSRSSFRIGPMSGHGSSTSARGSRHQQHEATSTQQPGDGWEFGGLGLDGREVPEEEDDDYNEKKDEDGDNAEGHGPRAASGAADGSRPAARLHALPSPPCCKHLLACVLAERWASGLGRYVHEQRVSLEEAAGLIGVL
jgi:hypothetical protein